MGTFLTWYQSGGPLMLPLALVAAAGLLVLAERIAYVVKQSRVHARPFMERVISLVRADRIDEALDVCASHDSALPDLGLVILRNRGSDEADLQNVSRAAALAVVPALTRRVAWLKTFAITAGLTGILGAISNLHEGLEDAARAGAPENAALTAVIYALRPLGAGTLTAIPLVLGHAFVQNASGKVIAHLDEFGARLVNALLKRPDIRLGHR